MNPPMKLFFTIEEAKDFLRIILKEYPNKGQAEEILTFQGFKFYRTKDLFKPEVNLTIYYYNKIIAEYTLYL